MAVQPHAAGLHQHRNGRGGAPAAALAFEFGRRPQQAVRRRFFEVRAIDACLDQLAFRPGRPLVVPVLLQSLQARPVHKIRSGHHGRKRECNGTKAT